MKAIHNNFKTFIMTTMITLMVRSFDEIALSHLCNLDNSNEKFI